jgi:L-fuconolactonase
MTTEQRPAKPHRGLPPALFVDQEWLALRTEEVLEPGLPIVDAHHHLWERSGSYLVPQLLEDLHCGHDIRGTVYVEGSHGYRSTGDERFASVGEVAYANGVADSFASGRHGQLRACAGIVGKVDLRMGAFAREVLQACLDSAPERLRGIRQMAAWDASPEVNVLMRPPQKDLLLDRSFRAGFAQLAALGLSFDAWVYHPQLGQLRDLADAFPDTTIIVDHVGGIALTGPYAGRRDEVHAQWKASIQSLAERPNVFIKIGGMNSRLHGFDFMDRDLPPSSLELAKAWKPYVETCLEAFGTHRAMFESNFPPDKCGCSARVLWNAFKRLTAACTGNEKSDLFSGTAMRVYRLPPELIAPA